MTAIPPDPPYLYARRLPRRLREQEILRIAAELSGDDPSRAVIDAREQVLRWAQNKVIGQLPAQAWEHTSFEHFSSGRLCSAVRLNGDERDIWSLRIEDPDKSVAGRTWTSEVTIVSASATQPASFTLRLVVGTSEQILIIEPHVPGVVRQLIERPGLFAGKYRLFDHPFVIKTTHSIELLMNALVDPSRKVPIIALSVPSEASDPDQPLLDAKTLAQACAGLAVVVVIPAAFTWSLTEEFGKQLSVYEGAARVYLPGFTEDANPFGGHELVLPPKVLTPTWPTAALTRLRWIAANGSVRRLNLGRDVVAFASLKAEEIQQRQARLAQTGASEREQLEAAEERLALMEVQLAEAVNYQQEFSDLHAAAEERAEAAETQLRAATFRIQQLLSEVKGAGTAPDSQIPLPETWAEFTNWCDVNLAGRVLLTPRARRALRDAVYEDVQLAAKSLLWLANEFREAKMGEPDGSLRDRIVAPGVLNAHCGSDSFMIEWQDKSHDVEWHIKNGGNTHDPTRCLRIYYFWDDQSQQVVIATMPAHIRTDAT
ncbi:MAG: hypothetical protein WBW84_16605 [Acidobacteriaceae bacterium]